MPQFKVLLVDDEEEFVKALAERLQMREFDARVALDGEQALQIIRSDVPDVMVVDLKMPGIDGFEVLRRVKRNHPGVEIIMLTGHGSERDEETAYRLGAFQYLQKPVDIHTLVDCLKRAYTKKSEDAGAAYSQM